MKAELRIIALIAALAFLGGCLADSVATDPESGNGPGNGSDQDEDENGISGSPPFDDASGFAQKGPFRAGSLAILTALDEDGERTGEEIETTVGEWGEFDFGEVNWNGPAIITVSGEWFDESSGNFSSEVIELKAVVEIPDSAEDDDFLGNVNLFSHLQAIGALQEWRSGNAEDLDDALDGVAGELRNELDLIGDPRHLNLFEHADDPLIRHESGILMSYSIGAAHMPDASAFIDAFDNAWDNGALSDDFLAHWDDMVAQTVSVIEDGAFDAAIQHLKDNYNGVETADTLLTGGGTAIINACQPTTTTEPAPRLCLGQPQTMTLSQGESKMFWFRAPYDGAFRFRTTGDLSVHDTIVRLWGSIDDDGEGVSNPRETKGIHDTNTISSRILDEGDRVYIEVEAYDDDGSPMEVTLSAGRQNEGSEANPAWIFPAHSVNPYLTTENMQHFVGSQHSSEGDRANHQSFYRFLSSGFSTLRYYEFACGWTNINGYTTVQLFRSNTVSGAFDSSNLVESVNMEDHYDDTGDCEVDLEVSDNALYFIRVYSDGMIDSQYQSGSMYTRPNATGSPVFNNAGRTIHFRGME